LTITQRIGKKRKEHQNQAQRQATNRDHSQETHQYAQAGSQAERTKQISQRQDSIISQKRSIYSEYKPLD
jgi:hypothetical protein